MLKLGTANTHGSVEGKMSEIVKENIDPHAVIVDTNILWHKDKSKVVNPEFDKFWESHAAEANLELVIPEVVIGELLVQQTNSALKRLLEANKQFDELTTFTGKKYSHRVTEDRLKGEIQSRLDSWALKKAVHRLATPIDQIEWDILIENSIWRRPPFSYGPKKENQEKGFRDSLILESIVSYCNSEIDKKVVFICNDKLLRETSEKRLESNKSFSAFESLDDVEGYLRLEKENLEQSFIKSIISKASKKFFKHQNQDNLVKNSLFYEVDLLRIILKNHEDKFNNPQSQITGDFESADYSRASWRPYDIGVFSVVGQPQFQNIEGDNTYHWVSKIRFNQDYEGKRKWEDEAYSFAHEMNFDVFWKVNISLNERFTKMEFLNLELIESKFTPKDD